MEKRKIILCPNPYRDKDMHVAAQSKAILDEAGFETVVCLPFQKEGYGADLGLPIGQLPRRSSGPTCSLPSAATERSCTWQRPLP